MAFIFESSFIAVASSPTLSLSTDATWLIGMEVDNPRVCGFTALLAKRASIGPAAVARAGAIAIPYKFVINETARPLQTDTEK